MAGVHQEDVGADRVLTRGEGEVRGDVLVDVIDQSETVGQRCVVSLEAGGRLEQPGWAEVLAIQGQVVEAGAGDDFQLIGDVKDVFEEDRGVVPMGRADPWIIRRAEQARCRVERVDFVVVGEAPAAFEIEMAVVIADVQLVSEAEDRLGDRDVSPDRQSRSDYG